MAVTLFMDKIGGYPTGDGSTGVRLEYWEPELNVLVEAEIYRECYMSGQVKINKKFQRKIVNIFLPITFSVCFGCSKELSH